MTHVLGSFILAVVDRMYVGKDWVKGRSQCDSCGQTLQPRDLVPLVSWLSTAGKCRYCSVGLSPVYPLVELAVGLVFVVSYVFWPYSLDTAAEIWRLALWFGGVVLMTGLFIFDLRWYLLPNKLVYPLIIISAVWALNINGIDILSFEKVTQYVSAVAVGAGFFSVLYWASKGKWIGDGDIRLGVAIGLFSGTWG